MTEVEGLRQTRCTTYAGLGGVRVSWVAVDQDVLNTHTYSGSERMMYTVVYSYVEVDE